MAGDDDRVKALEATGVPPGVARHRVGADDLLAAERVSREQDAAKERERIAAEEERRELGKLLRRNTSAAAFDEYVAAYNAKWRALGGSIRPSFCRIRRPAVQRLRALHQTAERYFGEMDDNDPEETAYFRAAIRSVNERTPELPLDDEDARRLLRWLRKHPTRKIHKATLHSRLRMLAAEVDAALEKLDAAGYVVLDENGDFILDSP